VAQVDGKIKRRFAVEERRNKAAQNKQGQNLAHMFLLMQPHFAAVHEIALSRTTSLAYLWRSQ
jgi:hypothetical protein